MQIKTNTSLIAALSLFTSFGLRAEGYGDNYDLDDIRNWDIVSIETCLDAAVDTIPGHSHKVEMKMIRYMNLMFIPHLSGKNYNVECNAKKRGITEIEQEINVSNPYFKKMAKVSQSEVKKMALAIHPSKIMLIV